jgi:hypothetical protein
MIKKKKTLVNMIKKREARIRDKLKTKKGPRSSWVNP